MTISYNLKLKVSLILLLSLVPVFASAINLGRITTNSMQGEPFDADIAIENTPTVLDHNQLKAKLASEAEFEEVGLNITPYHNDLTFKPYRDKGLNWFIKVKSTKPLSKQFVNFLVSFDYPGGHSLREYMVILQSSVSKQVATNSKANQAANKNFEVAITEDNTKIVRIPANITSLNTKPNANLETKTSRKNNVSVSFGDQNNTIKSAAAKAQKTNKITVTEFRASSKNVSQVTTKSGDSLWRIAVNNTSSSKDVQKMMYAIYTANKKAFINNDINRLKQNRKLNIPAQSELNKIAYKDAVAFVKSEATSRMGSVSRVASKVNGKLAANTKKLKSSTKSGDIIKLTSIKADLENIRKLKDAKQKLKIVTKKDDVSEASKYLLASEELIAKQKENQELKEQMLILQAQLKDMKTFVNLKENKSSNSKSISSKELSSEKIVQSNSQVSNNPLLATDYLPETDSSNPVESQLDNIAISSDINGHTNTDYVVNSTVTEKLYAAKNSISSYIGATVASLSKIGNRLTNTQTKVVFWLWFIGVLGCAAIFSLYYYWTRYYRMRPATPDFMAQATRTDQEEEFVVDDFVVKTKPRVVDSEINANFDLVNAYIELNDFITARKILDEIMQTGNSAQKADAKKILDSIPA